jgi:hypothetical protein
MTSLPSSGHAAPRLGRRRPGRAALTAALLGAGLLLAPAASHPAAAQTTPALLPAASGAAEIDAAAAAPDLAPETAGDLGTSRWRSTWSYGDATHYRIDTHVVAPELLSRRMTIVANGTSLVWYEGIYHRAATIPLTSTSGAIFFSYFLGGATLAEAQAIGLLASGGGTQIGLGPGGTSPTQLSYLGQTQVLSRTADIYQWGPLESGTSGSSGSVRVYIDHASRYVLRLELFASGAQSNATPDLTFRLTTFSPGQGPSAAALAYTPPVPARSLASSGTSSGSASGGLGMRWKVPKGFIAADAPHGYTLTGSGRGVDQMWGKRPAAVDARFSGSGDAFLYIQEQVRVSGLPAALRTGAARHAGTCTVWTGRYPDGLRRLVLARGQVSLLAVANRLAQKQLVRYAAHHIC